MSNMQLSGSRRVRINRSVLTKDSSNAPAKRSRSSVSGNFNNAGNPLIQGDPCASHRNADGDQCSSQEKMSAKPSVRRPGTSQYAHVSSTCVVQLKPLESTLVCGPPAKRMEAGLQSSGEGAIETAGKGGGCTSETEGNHDAQKQSTLSLRDYSVKKPERRLTKSTSCFTCCDVKFIPSKNDSLAVGRSCDSKAKETTKKQTSGRLDRGTGKNPVVKLCNISSIFRIPADSLHSRCILPEELKGKSIHCFKRDCGKRLLLEFYPASRTSGRGSQPQLGLQAERNPSPLSQAQRPVAVADILTRTPSGVRCDRHVGAAPNAHRSRVTKRLSGSSGSGSRISLPTVVLEPCVVVPAPQITAASSSCEPGALGDPGLPSGAGMKRILPDMPPNQQNEDEESGLSIAAGVAAQAMSEWSEECYGDTSQEEEDGLNGDITDTFSCQRTKPYQELVSCARTYISLPFQKLRRSGKRLPKNGPLAPTHKKAKMAPANDATANDTPANDATANDTPADDATANDTPADDATANDTPANNATANDTPADDATANDTPANDATADDTPANDATAEDAPADDATAEDTPVNDAPVQSRAPCFTKAAKSVPAEGPATGTEVCREHEMLCKMKTGSREDSCESVKLDETAATLAPEGQSETWGSFQGHGHGHQSDSLGDIEQRWGLCHTEEASGGCFWEMSATQKEKLQHFKIPLKMDTDRPQSHPPKQPGVATTTCRAAAGPKALSCSPSSSGRPPGVTSRPLDSPQRRRTSPLNVPAGRNSDDDASLHSEDEAGDCVHPSDSAIMCEIKDTSTTQSQRTPSLGSSSRVGGGTEDTMDPVKAYEQDAIVLDVIQDDPELFGTIAEEPLLEQQEKPERPLCAEKGGPGNPPRTRSRITWDKKESFAESPDPTPKYTDKGRVMLHDVNGESNSETVVSDGPPSNTLAGDEPHPLAVESKASPTSDGTGEWLCPDFMASFQDEQLKMDPETFAQRAVICAGPGPPNSGFSVICAETETSTTRWSTPNTAGPLSGPPDRDVYCKYYFSSKHMCFRKVCWFLHVPVDGDEKFCTEVVIRFSRDANQCILQRAAAVFVNYYQKCPPGIHFDLHALKLLLSALLEYGIVKDVLSVLRVIASYRILPPSEFILALFDHVSQCCLRVATSDLMDVTSMCVDAGLPFAPAHLQHMQHCLEQLGVPAQQRSSFLAKKLRDLGTDVWRASGEVQVAMAEVVRCREQGDWTRLGAIFCSLCASQPSLADLRQLSGRVALTLLEDSAAPAAAPLPFAQFAQAVCQDRSANGLMSNLVGRIGVSMMFRYYGAKQWQKGRQLLDTLTGLNINYSVLKSLLGSEGGPSRGQTVSVAAEVFLMSGSMESALQVLRDNDWLSSPPARPCDADTAQSRQALLCQLAESCIQKGVHRVALEVLTKLPGLQDQAVPAATFQHTELFNRHLSSCLEKQSLTVASDSVEFMLAKSVSVDTRLLRTLIHKLGKQNVWLKARSLFRCAVSMGCYPPAQVNPYCRLLPVPYSLSEVEMAIAVEMFMVSNASEFQGSSQAPLQVVLKRKEGSELATEDDYNAAGNRLLSAAQIANPKLVIKYATVNPSQEQVFTLNPLSARKWLTQNMKWAASIWQEGSDDPPTSDSLAG